MFKSNVKKYVNSASKIVGMFGMMLAIAVMLVGAPAASASRVTEGKLAIEVFDSVKGGAVPGATVLVMNMGATPVAKGISDINGAYAVSLPQGIYVVKVIADNYKTSEQYATVTARQATTVKADIQPNNADPVASSVTMATSPAADGKLSVNVLDASKGSAVVEATVVVFDAYGNAIAKGLTNSNGYFAIMVRPGAYKVQITANGYAAYGQGADVTSAQATTVKADLQPASDR